MATTRSRTPKTEEVDRKSALVREESFVERFTGNMNATPALYNPLDNRIYDASPRNRVMKNLDDRSQEVKALIRKHAERDLMKTYEEMPKNPAVIFEVWHQQMFAPRGLKVVAAGAAFSPTEELVRRGASSAKARVEDLNRLIDLVATQENVFYYIGAFSATGWSESCKQVLVGGNYLVALCDLYQDAWRTYYAPDARWRSAMRVYDLATDEEKIEAIRAFAKRHTFSLLMDEFTEDFVYEELGYPIPIVREAFELIAAEDRFVRYDTSELPYRLTRTYG